MSLEKENQALTTKNSSQADAPCSDGEKNDGATLGQSLIKFMSLATGSVKTALQKPANYKKNINHRRYLQKQLKICTRRKKRSTKAKTTQKTRKTANKETPATTSEVWIGHGNCGDIFLTPEGNNNQYFTTGNNLFLPYDAPCNGLGNGFAFPNNLTNDTIAQNGFRSWDSFAYSGQLGVSAMQQMDNSSAILRDDTLPVLLHEDAEQFLTGEELTHVLDINDLFVPERAHELCENSETVLKYSSCTFDETAYNCFQTVPSTTSILSW